MKKGGISWDGWVAVCVLAAQLLVESVALADKRALALIECMFHSVIISHACMDGWMQRFSLGDVQFRPLQGPPVFSPLQAH